MLSWLRLPAFWRRRRGPVSEAHAEPATALFPCWWGSTLMADQESRFWKIGENVVCVARYRDEWQTAHWSWKTHPDRKSVV